MIIVGKLKRRRDRERGRQSVSERELREREVERLLRDGEREREVLCYNCERKTTLHYIIISAV